ncbi:hypothetical protein E2C01_061726 [Portunus trituberculatus]|uniref:Uncharacterized protein n=1 Tax=Portunus trituberculatus TaxID=210409 RepID=A0A5B7HCM4_PORTR|nr:hypothetical protein [Portunus trituberculatus]
MPHQCGLTSSPPLNSNNWKMSKRGPAGSSLALPTQTTITPYLPSISPHWLPDTERSSSGWVEASCAIHGYDTSSTPTCPSQPMPHVTQTTVTNIVRSPPWCEP